ncbi:MAG: twin-arginine translocase TatA/TatE family subunit [Deltaproteobacteria bacterium]|nr:twin-arginine translocase TatA/TatE family subunit [Deltaproteobacteria bacterium]MBN2673121.1 twin-arginine translocase TatA/TatE family subunit [Deltaproteobacteria bacterium]
MSQFPLVGIPFFSPGLPELLVIAGVVVLIFGASKLPKLGKGLGEGIRNFKNGLKNEDDKGDAESKESPKLDE